MSKAKELIEAVINGSISEALKDIDPKAARANYKKLEAAAHRLDNIIYPGRGGDPSIAEVRKQWKILYGFVNRLYHDMFRRL